MSDLQSEVSLSTRNIVLFGKSIPQPRLVGWAGALPYAYSGQILEPRAMGPRLRRLMTLTSELSGQDFNHALLNLYRNGQDSMGMHCDDEPELGPNPIIASWSFGATRRFLLTEKRSKVKHKFDLCSGQLLVMEGQTQREFRHGLPKTPSVTDARLNVTFRRVFPLG